MTFIISLSILGLKIPQNSFKCPANSAKVPVIRGVPNSDRNKDHHFYMDRAFSVQKVVGFQWIFPDYSLIGPLY